MQCIYLITCWDTEPLQEHTWDWILDDQVLHKNRNAFQGSQFYSPNTSISQVPCDDRDSENSYLKMKMKKKMKTHL